MTEAGRAVTVGVKCQLDRFSAAGNGVLPLERAIEVALASQLPARRLRAPVPPACQGWGPASGR